jgi:hypothetical protein
MRLLTLLSLLPLVGCVSSDFDATLTDHSDALTTSGADKLFDVDLTSADSDVPLADVQLTYKPVGGTMTVLNFSLTVDTNGDGALGQGDRITAIEPGPDLLNSGNAGQSFQITLAEKTGPNAIAVLWEGSWQAQ